jgi:hypothetical protein
MVPVPDLAKVPKPCRSGSGSAIMLNIINLLCSVFQIITYVLGFRADELMLVLQHRLKGASGDPDVLHAELLELCRDHLVEIIALLINNRHTSLSEFQVCKNYCTVVNMYWFQA